MRCRPDAAPSPDRARGPAGRAYVARLAVDLFELVDVVELFRFRTLQIGEPARNDPDGAAIVLHVEHLHRLELGRVGALVNRVLPVVRIEAFAPLLLELPDLPQLVLVVEGL